MEKVEFTRSEKELIAKKIQLYFREELEQEIGGFDAQFLLDFFAEEIGALWYNQGVKDAQQVIEERTLGVVDALDELLQSTDIGR